MSRHTSLAVLLSAALLVSCTLYDKNTWRDITAPTSTTSRIKFHNFSPGSVAVQFFANDSKMTASLTGRCTTPVPADTAACNSTGIEGTTGVSYGALGSGGLYDAIAPGTYTLTSKIAANETVVSNVPGQVIADGKYYSFYMSGIYDAATKTAEAFVIEDNIPSGTIDFTTAYVRFVNAVPNATGQLTLYAKNTTTSTETAVGDSIAYKSAGAFIALPEGTYDVGARYYQSVTNATGLSRTALSFVGGRVYTITARGNTATASTMSLDFTSNQR